MHNANQSESKDEKAPSETSKYSAVVFSVPVEQVKRRVESEPDDYEDDFEDAFEKSNGDEGDLNPTSEE